MASSGKQKTTMAKLMRESRLRERRLDKQARKDARKQAPAGHQDHTDMSALSADDSAGLAAEEAPLLKTATPALSETEADSGQRGLST